jgi:tRNA(Ile)-lysidine synthase
LREENEYINLQAENWVEKELRTDRSGEFYIKLTAFNKLPNVFSRRVLRLIISRFIKYLHGVDAGHIDSILELSKNPNPNASIHLPKGLIVNREYDKLLFSLDEDCFNPFNYIIDAPCTLKIKETGQELAIEKSERKEEEPVDNIDPSIAFLNGDKIRFPLTVRTFKPGDKFIPLGMKGHKKVKDYFIDFKVPVRERKITPILLQNNKIAWICGYRIDDRFKVTPGAKTILKCKIDGFVKSRVHPSTGSGRTV